MQRLDGILAAGAALVGALVYGSFLGADAVGGAGPGNVEEQSLGAAALAPDAEPLASRSESEPELLRSWLARRNESAPLSMDASETAGTPDEVDTASDGTPFELGLVGYVAETEHPRPEARLVVLRLAGGAEHAWAFMEAGDSIAWPIPDTAFELWVAGELRWEGEPREALGGLEVLY